jgi:formate dehydrogenase assembly factor FdhD
MKAIEFQTRLTSDRTLTVPEEIARKLSAGQLVRIIMLIPESAEDLDWAHLTAEQFLKGYEESDAVYDDLSSG